MAYTNVFGGSPVQPSDVSYRAISIDQNYTYTWPQTNPDTDTVIGRINRVTANAASLSVYMPDATQVSPGQDALFYNTDVNTYTILDAGGNTITTVASGQMKYIWVVTNTTANGTWNSITFGASVSNANAAALAGYGLLALGVTLNQNYPVQTKPSNYTVLASDRSSNLVWTGGAGTFAFTASGTLTNGWFVNVKNSGSGAVVLDPNGAETIDGLATISLNPQESAIVMCDGTNLYTIGRGRELVDLFNRIVKNVAGGSNVTLTATESAFDVIEFTGTLTANINVIYPTAVSRWYVYNNTSGAFTLTNKTSGGTGVSIPQGSRSIIYCDGTNVVFAVDTSAGTVTSIASGTGLTGGPITTSGTISVANNGITAALFRQSAALSIVGNATNATANVADITYANDGDVIKRSGTTLISGKIVNANIDYTNILVPITSGGTGQITANAALNAFLPTQTGNSQKFLQTNATNTSWQYPVNRSRTSTSAVTTVNSAIPLDNTIPQNTEGVEVMNVSITPVNSSDRLKISGHVCGVSSNSNVQLVVAIFQDSGVNAIAAVAQLLNNNDVFTIPFDFDVPASVAVSTTIRIRVGVTAGNFYVNGANGATTIFSTIPKSSLIVEEYAL